MINDIIYLDLDLDAIQRLVIKESSYIAAP